MDLVRRLPGRRHQLGTRLLVCIVGEIKLAIAFRLPATVVSIHVVCVCSCQSDRANDTDAPGIHDAFDLDNFVRTASQHHVELSLTGGGDRRLRIYPMAKRRCSVTAETDLR